MEENSKEANNNDKKYLLGIFVTVLPFWGYLLSYAYELGYNDIFNIPSEYIIIKLENVLSLTFGLLLFSIFMIDNINFVFPFFSKYYSKGGLSRFLLTRLTSFGLLGILYLLSDVSEYLWYFYVLLVFTHILLPLLLALLKSDKSISYKEQFETDISKRYQENNLYNKILNKYSLKISLTTIFVVLSISLSAMFGGIVAKKKMNFFILNDDKSKVVCKINDDNLIMIKTDELLKRKVKKIFIINQSKLDSFILTTYLPFQQAESKSTLKPKLQDSTKTK
jgi:hypothetical protein